MTIIITGLHGYISNSIKRHFYNYHKCNENIELFDVRGEEWKKYDFSNVDTIIHCSALVHKGSAKYSLDEYIRVNATLTEQIAKKAKAEGVGYFIFFSTAGVYGTTGSLFKDIIIDYDTPLCPIERYEISKRMAEERLLSLGSKEFKIAIIRPPFVYGKNCPGNYNVLKKAILTLRFIPLISNKKSMIYIDNLCEFIYQIWTRQLDGIFFPQDLPYRCTSEMCQLIAKMNNKRVVCSSFINPLIKIGSLFNRKIRIAFGNEYYKEDISNLGFDYSIISFEDSIRITEKKDI